MCLEMELWAKPSLKDGVGGWLWRRKIEIGNLHSVDHSDIDVAWRLICAPKVEQSGSEWGWGLNSAVDTLRIGLMIRLASAYRSWLGADKEQPSIVWCAVKQDVRDVSSVHCPSFHRRRRDGRGEFPLMDSTLDEGCFYVTLWELSAGDAMMDYG